MAANSSPRGPILSIKPFLKWAGGKRWLVDRPEFKIPQYSGKYIEPFVGGGAVFFSHAPTQGIISDANSRLIDTYIAIKNDWRAVVANLEEHQKLHSKDYYYEMRSSKFEELHLRASQFLYLNRACWNGLYRENLRGEFNVPIGTKSKIVMDDDNFEYVSKVLQKTQILNEDFSVAISHATEGDLIFVDPPYTVAHNFNGFIKYNQNIFSWNDQIRLRDCLVDAKQRGARIMLTNASHDSIRELYSQLSSPIEITRASVIAGSSKNRVKTSELLYVV
jgi:DNA adenine methylase